MLRGVSGGVNGGRGHLWRAVLSPAGVISAGERRALAGVAQSASAAHHSVRICGLFALDITRIKIALFLSQAKSVFCLAHHSVAAKWRW